MNVDKILKLVEAGFTKDEIIRLEDTPNNDLRSTENPANNINNAVIDTTEDIPKSNSDKLDDVSNRLNNRIDELSRLIINKNIQESSQPPQQNVDDILTSLIFNN